MLNPRSVKAATETAIVIEQASGIEGSSTIVSSTSDPASPTTYNSLSGATPPPAAISVSPALRAFGPVTVGQLVTRTFTVSNPGGETLTGTASVNSPFSIQAGASYSVAAGGSATVTVGYKPASAVFSSNNVVFSSIAGVKLGAVTGTGLTPALLKVSPGSVNFGTVAAGAQAAVTLTVSNAGGTALSGSLASGSPRFTVSTNLLNLPGFGAALVTIRFTPLAEASYSNTVTFASDGGNLPVPVFGKGAVAPAAGFDGAPVTGTVPLKVTFTDTSSGTITNRTWTFGDGSSTQTAAAVVSHLYTQTGLYPVALTVKGPVGQDTFTQPGAVTVVPKTPASLRVIPGALDFGAVLTGATASAAFIVTNEGESELTGSVAVAGGPFTVNPPAFILPGSGWAAVQVDFSPLATGGCTQDVLFSGSGGTVTGLLQGSGVATAPDKAVLQVNPVVLKFGATVTGTPRFASCMITNAGALAMTGSLVLADGPFACSAETFSVPGFGWTNVEAGFMPMATGTFTARLVFTGNGGGTNVLLKGTGVPPSVIRMSALSYTGTEGYKAKVQVWRTGHAMGAVSVKYATKNGTALAGSDYVTKTGVLTWAEGDMTPREIKMALLADALAEVNETFKFRLFAPAHATLGAPSSSTVVIRNAAPVAALALSASAPPTPAPDPLAVALDGGPGGWVTSADLPWTAVDDPSARGGRCARSGTTDPGRISWIQADLNGAGVLRFQWALTGEAGGAGVLMDQGVVIRQALPGTGWTAETLNLPEGPHRLQWIFAAGQGTSAGSLDLDQVEWVPAP